MLPQYFYNATVLEVFKTIDTCILNSLKRKKPNKTDQVAGFFWYIFWTEEREYKYLTKCFPFKNKKKIWWLNSMQQGWGNLLSGMCMLIGK